MKGLIGRKLGMTQVFLTDGSLVPVTVVEVLPNVVLQKKTTETDGYDAVQLGVVDVKEQKQNQAQKGFLRHLFCSLTARSMSRLAARFAMSSRLS